MYLDDLQEKRNQQAADIKTLNDKLQSAKGDDWTAEDDANWQRANDAYDSTVGEIEKEQRKVEAAQRAEHVTDLQERNQRSAPLETSSAPRGTAATHHITEQTRDLALQSWLRRDAGLELSHEQNHACALLKFNPDSRYIDINMPAYRHAPVWTRGGRVMSESRANQSTTATEGGETIPQGFAGEIDRAMLAFNGPRQVSRVIKTATGNAIPWPTVDDTSVSGRLLAESAALTTTDITYSSVTLNAYKYSSDAVKASSELLEDSAFNLATEFGSLLGERLGRKTAEAFTNGTGSSQPQGCAQAATVGKTAASATAITADELLDLLHALDPSYRGLSSTGWMLHDNVLLVLRKLKSNDSQYLWQPGLQAGVPDRLAGYPVTVNQNMNGTVATTEKTILFGAFEKFIIRDAGNVRLFRLDELYRANDQTGFIAFSRHESKVIRPDALQILQQA